MLGDEWHVLGGWLPSLTLMLGAMTLFASTRERWFCLLSPVPLLCLILGILSDLGRPLFNGPGLDIIIFLAFPSSLLLTTVGIVAACRKRQRGEPAFTIIAATLISSAPVALAFCLMIHLIVHN